VKILVTLLSIGILFFVISVHPQSAFATSQGGPWTDSLNALACIGGPESAADGGNGSLGYNVGSVPLAYGSNGCVRVWCDSGNIYAHMNWDQSGPFTVGLYRNGAGSPEYWNSNVGSNNITLTLSPVPSIGLRFGFIIVTNSNNTIGNPHTSFNIQCEQVPSSTPVPASATPVPSPTITPTSTPSGPPLTTANVTFHVEGIDVNNIPNVLPKPGRHGAAGWPFIISVYSGSTLVRTYTDTAKELTDDPSSPLYGTFQNTAFKLYSSTTGLPTGTYSFYVSTPFGSLRKQIGTGTFPVTGGQNVVLVPIDPNNPTLQGIPFLTTGDINGDNVIDATDYSILHDCYGLNVSNYASNAACKSDHDQLMQKFPSLPSDFVPGDINDNGQVDGIDYNTLLRGMLGNSLGA